MGCSTLSDRIQDSELVALHADVREFAERVWRAGRLLRGFTDHGPNHARRVIRRIEEFLRDAYLSEDEAFVLSAACWLHDVGMQDYGLLEELTPDRSLDTPLSLEEYDRVRAQHAERARKLLYDDQPIVLRGDQERRECCPLPRLGCFKRYVAEAAYGHSTAGFRRVSRLPDEDGPVGLEPFRHGLLAALILMGDECDLDHSRAASIDEAGGVERFSSISALHLLKHRYVTRSQIAVSPEDRNARQLKVVYNWPKGDRGIVASYRRWIEGKLFSQMNLAQPTLARELGIRFYEPGPFALEEPELGMRVEGLPEKVLPFLLAEEARMTLANLGAVLRDIRQGLGRAAAHVLVEPGGAGELGARDVALWAIAELMAQSAAAGGRAYRQVEVDAEDEPTATDAAALFERVASSPGDGRRVDERRPEEVIELLQERLERTGPVIVLLCNAHRLPADSKRLLARCLIPAAGRMETLKILATADTAAGLLPPGLAGEHVKVLEMPRVGRGDVLEMLARYTLRDGELRESLLEQRDDFTQAEALSIAAWLAPRSGG